MKEPKTKEELEDAAVPLIGCALSMVPLMLLIASIAIGFIFGAGYGFLAFFACLLAVFLWLMFCARSNLRKAKKATEKEREDD